MTERKALTPVQRKKRIIRQTACVRRGVQVLFFLTMPGAFAAGFSGVKSICSALGSTQPLSWNAFTMALAGLCAFTLLFGRFFCGYACAFGTFGDLIYWLSGLVQKKLLRRKKQVTLPQKLLAPAQKVKFVLLAAIVILSVTGIYPRLSGYSSWTVFSLLTSLRFPAAENRGGVLIFLLIVAGMAVQERFFCQFLCPMGAVFALQPILPQGQLQRQPE